MDGNKMYRVSTCIGFPCCIRTSKEEGAATYAGRRKEDKEKRARQEPGLIYLSTSPTCAAFFPGSGLHMHLLVHACGLCFVGTSRPRQGQRVPAVGRSSASDTSRPLCQPARLCLQNRASLRLERFGCREFVNEGVRNEPLVGSGRPALWIFCMSSLG